MKHFQTRERSLHNMEVFVTPMCNIHVYDKLLTWILKTVDNCHLQLYVNSRGFILSQEQQLLLIEHDPVATSYFFTIR